MERNKRETENDYIRMRESNRKKFELACGDKIALFRDKEKTPLSILVVKQAYRDDILNYPGEDICFVTDRNFTFYKGSKKDITFSLAAHDPTLLITMGADPEFGLVDQQGCPVKASLFDRTSFSLYSELGWDGGQWPAEIRPKPSPDITELCGNISKIIKEGSNLPFLKDLRWKPGAVFKGTGGRYLPLGGHIHIGYAQGLENLLATTDIIRELIYILDHYIGTLLINIDGEKAESRKISYGHAGDYRPQGSNRVEWRVPSGMWLCDQKYAEAVLGLTKFLAVQFYKSLTPRTTKTEVKKIRQDKFKITEEDLNSNVSMINSHLKFTTPQLKKRLKSLSEVLKDDYYINLFNAFLKMPSADIHKKEEDDLRAIWC